MNLTGAGQGQPGGYEKRDVSANKVILLGVIGLVFLVVIVILLMNFFTMSTEQQIYEAILRPESAPLRELRAREVEVLNSYQLLDSARGIYRIPVERAMYLMVEEAFKGTAPAR